MNKAVYGIKRIIENPSLNNNFQFDFIPKEEARIFLSSFSLFDEILAKFDFSKTSFNKTEIQKWGLIYLSLHNLFHSENNHDDLTKLEIFSTAPIFFDVKNLIDEEDYKKLIYSYFILGVASLKINHSLPHLISEKLLLGEFTAIGGLDRSLWGYKLKESLMPQVAQGILEKTEKDRHHHLIKKYKNFVPDFL